MDRARSQSRSAKITSRPMTLYSIRPGKPTVLAVAGEKPVFGLPGNPVSALVTFDLFVVPTIYLLGGMGKDVIANIHEYSAPSGGHDVYLTIDEVVQHIAEQESP